MIILNKEIEYSLKLKVDKKCLFCYIKSIKYKKYEKYKKDRSSSR
jgi:hypothetical protein